MKAGKKKFVTMGLIVFLFLQIVCVHAFAAGDTTKNSSDYALFAGSQSSPLTINASKVNITGDVHTNAGFVFQGSNLVLNGSCEAAGKITLETSKPVIGQRLKVLRLSGCRITQR